MTEKPITATVFILGGIVETVAGLQGSPRMLLAAALFGCAGVGWLVIALRWHRRIAG